MAAIIFGGHIVSQKCELCRELALFLFRDTVHFGPYLKPDSRVNA